MIKKENIFILSILILVFSLFMIEIQRNLINQNYLTILICIAYLITAYFLFKMRLGLTLVYLSYLFFTHAGIQIVDLFLEDPFINITYNTSWYDYSDSKNEAILIAFTFILFFCVCSVVMNMFSNKNIENDDLININNYGDVKWVKIGAILINIFTVYFIFQVLVGNLKIFGVYQEFHSSLNYLEFYSTGIFFYAIGITLILSNINSIMKNKLYIFIMLIPATLLIITGNRGEIFFPMLAGLGVLITRGLKLNIKIVMSIVFIIFLLIPLVKEIRNLDSISTSEIEISILDPFVEIGYTLRPLVYTVEWVENGEELLWGESFLVPFQRGVSNFVPFMDPIEYEGKPYSFRDRLPTMGYSIVAESYYNFGFIGLILIPLLITFFLSKVGDNSNKFLNLTFATGVCAILINNIRNAFSFVPGQVIMFSLIIIFVLIFSGYLNKENKIILR